MSDITILESAQTIEIGREPMVLAPLSIWRKAEDFLEDQEALASAPYRRRIRMARREIALGRVVRPFGRYVSVSPRT